MRKDEKMTTEYALQRCTIFLEKGSGARPWRLSARSLNGAGLVDRYFGSGTRSLSIGEVDLILAELTQFVREFLFVHGVQEVMEISADE
jgi:hypothetical protein